MTSAHSKNLSKNEIGTYLDDLISGLPEKLNFPEVMGSLEWRVKKLSKNNPSATSEVLSDWLNVEDKFKTQVADHLLSFLKK